MALAIATGRILWFGATPIAWSIESLAVPLVAGWIGQVLVGSWTHLVPAIGPGDQAAHALQRLRLGRGAAPRWLIWNAGTALGTIGLLLGERAMVFVGLACVIASLFAALGLLAAAVREGLRNAAISPRPRERSAPPPTSRPAG